MTRIRRMFSQGRDVPPARVGLFVPLAEVRQVLALANSARPMRVLEAAVIVQRWLDERPRRLWRPGDGPVKW